jgi:hypothetical protein
MVLTPDDTNRLRKLKEKVAVQKKHLKELEDHMYMPSILCVSTPTTDAL